MTDTKHLNEAARAKLIAAYVEHTDSFLLPEEAEVYCDDLLAALARHNLEIADNAHVR